MNTNPPDEKKKKQGERNPSASLQQKLRNYAKATGEDVALVLVRYLNERFPYRLSLSPFRDRFVLRGATLFTVWDKEPHRATRDIDLLVTGDNSAAVMREVIEAICAQPVKEEDSKETAIAEKCQALVSLGMTNTRMKDFYDLWYLSRAYAFDGAQLHAALQATFTRRETAYPVNGLPLALTDVFAENSVKQQQWRAFLGKAVLRKGVAELAPVIGQVRTFLQPPLQALAEGLPFALHWLPEEGWGDYTARAHTGLDEMTAEAQRLGLYE